MKYFGFSARYFCIRNPVSHQFHYLWGSSHRGSTMCLELYVWRITYRERCVFTIKRRKPASGEYEGLNYFHSIGWAFHLYWKVPFKEVLKMYHACELYAIGSFIVYKKPSEPNNRPYHHLSVIIFWWQEGPFHCVCVCVVSTPEGQKTPWVNFCFLCCSWESLKTQRSLKTEPHIRIHQCWISALWRPLERIFISEIG